MRSPRDRAFGVLIALGVAACADAAQTNAAASAAAVDSARLLTAGGDSANWISHGRTYDEQRFSPLAQINTATVARFGR